MRSIYRPFTTALLLAALLSFPAGVRAQFRYGAYYGAAGYNYARTQAVAGAAYGRVVSRNAAFGYYPGAAGYGPYPVQTPLNGFLTGSADVISSTGQYEISHQQANLTREQVKSAHIDNRRKMFDELRYEKANTPTQWQLQAEDRYERLQQARNNPPDTEIWDASALNLLLEDVQQVQATTGLRGALVPLDPDILPHVSLTIGSAKRSSTMLNNGGKLKWPPELDDPRFDEQRKEIDRLFGQAVKQASGSDGLSGRTMRELSAAVGQLQDGIDSAIADMTPSDNIRAKTYANQVEASAKLLRDPNIAKTLGGDWAAKGASVGDLVDNMTRNGQKFGPAGPAGRPYYSALYLSLLSYDMSLARLAPPGAPSPGLKPFAPPMP